MPMDRAICASYSYSSWGTVTDALKLPRRLAKTRTGKRLQRSQTAIILAPHIDVRHSNPAVGPPPPTPPTHWTARERAPPRHSAMLYMYTSVSHERSKYKPRRGELSLALARGSVAIRAPEVRTRAKIVQRSDDGP